MKKLIILACSVSVLFSIGCSNKKESKPVETVVVNEDSLVYDEHNAKNSLDYIGAYSDTLPTASGEGMLVSIEISDSTYVRTISYIGKTAKPIVEKGIYTWNDAGSTITFVGAEIPNQYFVAENNLIQLDTEGKRIEGDMAENYYIAKK